MKKLEISDFQALVGFDYTTTVRKVRVHRKKDMSIRKCFLSQISVAVSTLLLTTIQPLAAETASESERLQKLERAVEQLQKRNTELEQEVSGLKKQAASTAEVAAKMKTKVTYDGKTYVEKAVVEEEKLPVYVQQRGSELKLVLGGFIQANFEDGDVSAFEGRFGQTALKDRFRLRRARINLTGDFAEQFDFKIEGDFEQSDGLNSSRTAFEATDIFANWHQFPEAKSSSDNGKRLLAWNKLPLIRRSTLSSAVCLPVQSRPSGRSGCNFGGNPSRTFGRKRKIC